jgi:hypothetical protein
MIQQKHRGAPSERPSPHRVKELQERPAADLNDELPVDPDDPSGTAGPGDGSGGIDSAEEAARETARETSGGRIRRR